LILAPRKQKSRLTLIRRLLDQIEGDYSTAYEIAYSRRAGQDYGRRITGTKDNDEVGQVVSASYQVESTPGEWELRPALVAYRLLRGCDTFPGLPADTASSLEPRVDVLPLPHRPLCQLRHRARESGGVALPPLVHRINGHAGALGDLLHADEVEGHFAAHGPTCSISLGTTVGPWFHPAYSSQVRIVPRRVSRIQAISGASPGSVLAG
jgi:hypothetical protein